jgi:hypothetical protein
VARAFSAWRMMRIPAPALGTLIDAAGKFV